MPSYQQHPQAFASRLPLAPLVADPSLPLGELFTPDDLQQAFDRYQLTFGRTTKAVFTPAILLWTWLWQSLSQARSCGAAVIRTTVWLVAWKLPSWSEDTGVYCRARAKFPKALLRELALTIGHRVEDAAAAAWLYHGRHVHWLDGSTATLADTPQNQRAYPQLDSQAAGLGFPISRLVVLLALATATLEGLAYGPYQGKETGETRWHGSCSTAFVLATWSWPIATTARTGWWPCCWHGESRSCFAGSNSASTISSGVGVWGTTIRW